MLMERLVIAIAAAVVSLGTAAQQTPAPAALATVEIPAEISALLRRYEAAWQARDTTALAQMFAPDGVALPNGSRATRGEQAIAAEYARNAGSPLALRPTAFTQTHELAVVVGAFGPAPGKPDFGKFMLVLRRGPDEVWRIVADMDNMNAMLPMQAPSPSKP